MKQIQNTITNLKDLEKQNLTKIKRKQKSVVDSLIKLRDELEKNLKSEVDSLNDNKIKEIENIKKHIEEKEFLKTHDLSKLKRQYVKNKTEAKKVVIEEMLS
jgi:hypothetical protein